MSTSLQSLLKGLVKRYGLEQEMQKQKMPEYWADVVGERIARISEIRAFEHGVLRVHISEASWRSEVTLRREDIRRQLNARIGEDLIHEIQVR